MIRRRLRYALLLPLVLAAAAFPAGPVGSTEELSVLRCDSPTRPDLIAEGYDCAEIYNKGQLPSSFQQIGELYFKKHENTDQLELITEMFGETPDKGHGDEKLCVDDDSDPIKNIVTDPSNARYCEGGESPQTIKAGEDLKHADDDPEEPAGKYEVTIEGLHQAPFLDESGPNAKYTIFVDDYTEFVFHFNAGGFSSVAFFQLGEPAPAPRSDLTKSVRNITQGGEEQSNPFAPEGTANAGDVLEYRIVYENTGNATATGVVVKDPVPNKTQFNSCSPQPCGINQQGEIEWQVGDVPAGESRELRFRVTVEQNVNPGEEIKNQARSTSNEEPEEKKSNEVIVTITEPDEPQSDLDKEVRNVTQGGPFDDTATAQPGDTIEYRLTYTNIGDAIAEDVVVTDPVPDHTTFVSCEIDPPDTCGLNAQGDVEFQMGDVAPNESNVGTFQVTIDGDTQPGTEIKNKGTATSSNTPPEDSNEVIVTVPEQPEGFCTGQAYDVSVVLTGVLDGFVGPSSATEKDVFPDEETLSEVDVFVPGATKPIVQTTTLHAENLGTPPDGCKTEASIEGDRSDPNDPDEEPLTIDLNALPGPLADQIDLVITATAIQTEATPEDTEVTLVDLKINGEDVIVLQPGPNENTLDLDPFSPLGITGEITFHKQEDIPGGKSADAIYIEVNLGDPFPQELHQSIVIRVAHAEADVH